MAASFISTSTSRAHSNAHPRLRLVADNPSHRAIDPAREHSTKTAVLACLTARGSGNRELLRRASAAARELNGEFYAVVVSSRTRVGKMELRSIVDDAVLASRLGAKILWLESPDTVEGLLQLANQFHIGRVFLPRQRAALLSWLFPRTLCSGLLSRAKGIRIDVVGLGHGD